MKLVINRCYGGFSISDKAKKLLGVESNYAFDDYKFRNDNNLIKVVEELGEDASGTLANLRVVTISDEATDYEISEYDGFEDVIYVLNGKINYIY